MTEEKAQYSTAPASLNELKQRIEQGGTDWRDALAMLNETTGCKDLAAAMKQGWTVEKFWKILAPDSPTPEAEPDPMPAPQVEPGSPPTPTSQNGFTEAPASFNVKAISPQGFDIMLTLRDDDTARLLKRINKALKWLTDNKFAPTPARGGNAGGNGQGAGSGNGPKYCGHKSDGPGFCPTHGKELKQSKHHPGYYCPAKL